ncbi:MAG: response regulator [Ignavibacteriales bacterium]|nr:response regulator [Ignavibacteriales bacterium]
MVNNLKLDFIESINILESLARKNSISLPAEICRFLLNEFKLSSTFVAEEISKNEFKILGSISNSDEFSIKSILNLSNYDSVIENSKYENDLISECIISTDRKYENFESYLIFISEDKKILIVMQHKAILDKNEKTQQIQLLRFLQNIFKIWKNLENSQSTNQSVNSIDFLDKTIKGIVKEIRTISGLLTLAKEENSSNNVESYLDEIKANYQTTLKSCTDLIELISLESNEQKFSESKIEVSELINTISNRIKSENADFKIQSEVASNKIYTNKEHLEYIISNSVKLMLNISKSNTVKVNSDISLDNKLRIRISTNSSGIPTNKLENLSSPFEIKELSKFESGLSLTLIVKYIELLNGNLKFVNDKEFSLNIQIPIKINEKVSEEIPKQITELLKKDKILVIESDNESSKLLKNHLNRWNYETEIVNTGNIALNLIKDNKYVAVILNIDQENENSLELLQKLKNSKSTRNTPVIVFTVEPEKEKIYLMGAVEYLVKPINYNNLVEILTSYKLRRNSTVLCVDDDQPTLNLLKQAVQTAGFNVVAEHRPELVMDLILEKELDLAIIDLEMPKINGFDLIKLVKSHDKFSKLPIIIYTGKEDYHDDLQKIDGMFVDLLEKKSTSFNELENTIMNMIKSYEQPNIAKETQDNSNGPKILMAEDYKHSQIIVTRLLKKSGFENVIVVENGEEALNICEHDKIDLILMDMQMPVMNGFEATGKIRELEGYADTPIIALTAFAMKGDREKCLEAGATDYIPKPIDSKEFIEKVKYYTQVEAKV